jgi:hypothetical protein
VGGLGRGRNVVPLRRVGARFTATLLAVAIVACSGDDGSPAPPGGDAEAADIAAAARISAPHLCIIDADTCPGEPDDPPGAGIVCTGDADLGADPAGVPQPGALVGTITVDGDPLLRVDVPATDIAQRAGEPVALRFVLGVPVPAGEYRCRFDLAGEVTETSATIDGPAEPFWEHRICDRADALELAPGVLACDVDAEELPAGTTGVACTAGVRPDGQLLRLTYTTELDGGGSPEAATLDIDPGELPIATANGAVDATLFGGAAGDPIPAGEHTCRFELEDGSVVSERTFRIG